MVELDTIRKEEEGEQELGTNAIIMPSFLALGNLGVTSAVNVDCGVAKLRASV